MMAAGMAFTILTLAFIGVAVYGLLTFLDERTATRNHNRVSNEWANIQHFRINADNDISGVA